LGGNTSGNSHSSRSCCPIAICISRRKVRGCWVLGVARSIVSSRVGQRAVLDTHREEGACDLEHTRLSDPLCAVGSQRPPRKWQMSCPDDSKSHFKQQNLPRGGAAGPLLRRLPQHATRRRRRRRSTDRATRHSVMFCERVASAWRSLGNADAWAWCRT